MNGKIDTSVKIGKLILKNPVIPASGTFGNGLEFGEFYDVNKLGAITVKGITPLKQKGNALPRIVETASGMLNSVGLENPGIEEFVKTKLPQLSSINIPLIVNISAHSVEDYAKMASRLQEAGVEAVEINVSCPNVSKGGIQFGTDPEMVYKVTDAVKKVFLGTVITKLSPNVTDITIMAKAVEEAGADAVSLINTLKGMAIDHRTGRAILGNTIGGLSGPAIKPVALRMVYEVAKTVDIPIIGMGGVRSAEDAIEFIMAGATGVSVGAANFVDPLCCLNIIDGIEKYMIDRAISTLSEIRGCVK
jgi:dihydroorotate dehydrogenase (NAD+) catalytic subunit